MTAASAVLAVDAERGEAGHERGLLDPDAARHRRDVAEHPRADLHHDELGEAQVHTERQEAEAEQRRVDQVAGHVAAEELRTLLRVAEHGPDVAQRRASPRARPCPGPSG